MNTVYDICSFLSAGAACHGCRKGLLGSDSGLSLHYVFSLTFLLQELTKKEAEPWTDGSVRASAEIGRVWDSMELLMNGTHPLFHTSGFC